jgi:hypothetical protein
VLTEIQENLLMRCFAPGQVPLRSAVRSDQRIERLLHAYDLPPEPDQ